MQDGASAHTCEATLSFLRPLVNILEDWPSGSPDLNPIENLWAIMKRRFAALNPQTISQLTQIIREVWQALTTAELKPLTDSMRRRLEGVIEAGEVQTVTEINLLNFLRSIRIQTDQKCTIVVVSTWLSHPRLWIREQYQKQLPDEIRVHSSP
jgi:hypothetical protein